MHVFILPEGRVWFFLLFLLLKGVGGEKPTCTCQCCAEFTGSCYDSRDTTFVIGQCSDCTREACFNRFESCRASVVVNAGCLDLTSTWTLVVVVTILLAIGLALLLSVLRFKLQFIHQLFELDNPGAKDKHKT